MATERDYDQLSDRYTDPAVPVAPVGPVVTGAAAAAAGRAFLVSEYGSEEAVDQLIRRGRPRVGHKRPGESPVVRARISDQDFAAFKQLEDATGKTQAELVREGVHLLLAQHRLAG
ncbi:hypothetical protein BH09ACT6_BH09ACT6_03080 [soil metagenome]